MAEQGHEVDFSLIAACRGRYEALERFINSVFTLAHNPQRVELWIMADNDDVKTHEVVERLCKDHFPSWNIILGKRERTVNLNRDYINVAAEQSSGKYLWVLGNDVEILNVGWDTKLKLNIEEFVYQESPNDRLCYVYIDDDIHKVDEYGGCCFPLITRESFNAAGFFMVPDCTTWAADHYLWMMYKHLSKNRILDLRGGNGARLAHHAHHTGKAERDELNREIERNAQYGDISKNLPTYCMRLEDTLRNAN